MKRRFSPRLQIQLISLSLTGLLLSGFTPLPRLGAAPVHKPAAALSSARQLEARRDYRELPLGFEPNQGQTAEQVKFMARGEGCAIFLTADEAVLSWRRATTANAPANRESDVVRMKVVGANPQATVSGQAPQPGKSNYLSGNDRNKWRTDIPNYGRVQYDEIYPGIDLVYYGQQRQLEYDFIVAPGADAGRIALAFAGAETLKLDGNGDLVLQTAGGELRQHAPVIYQETAAGRQFVKGGYRLTSEKQVEFTLAAYDHSLPLVIDPVFGYATYLGGVGAESVAAVAVDGEGNLYLTGDTNGSAFPGTNVFSGAGAAAFVTKLDPGGSSVIYTTLLEGQNNDLGTGIAVDEAGNAYVAGTTFSGDFPLQTPFEDKLNHGVLACVGLFICVAYWGQLRSDGFVAKLNPAGNGLLFSTFLGGADYDYLNGLAISADHRIYVTGKTLSLNFPVKNEFQNNTVFSGNDSFVSVLAANGQSLVYSSYLRGTVESKAIAVDSAGNAYIAGQSDANLMQVKGANGSAPFRASNAGGTDAYVAKFNPAASGDASLVYATYLGGAGTDAAFGIAVDAQNRAYVTGVTGSTNFPLVAALDSTNQVNEAFVTCLNANGSGAVFSTFLGGSGAEAGTCITLDTTGNIVVGGHTTSTNFPLASAVQGTFGGVRDGFATKLAPGGTSILFSTYVGGNVEDQINAIVTDSTSSIYVAGNTRSGNFPVTGGALQSVSQGGLDAFAAKITFALPETIGVFVTGAAAFNLRNSLTAGPADISAFFGVPTDKPIVGDWNGDGIKTIGLFRDGTFFLHNRNESTGTPDLQFTFGQAGDIPIVGDWNGDGVDTIGVYRRASSAHFASLFLLRNSNSSGTADVTVSFGGFNDLPLAGDWNGDGIDTIGTFRNPVGTATSATFLLRNSNSAGTADITVSFGALGDLPITGDWDGNLTDTIGVFRDGVFTIRKFNNTSAASSNQLTIGFGGSGDKPLAGDWDGLP
ncbi:MAG: SBBP repeat-containing protein [Acidobacteria bacterium]|nr:SBBP repeat-containing protein [Acidobacteriota bacterium]MBI3426381.1 SBBP repeat-containing protein [Acidobacteriota bacterium]